MPDTRVSINAGICDTYDREAITGQAQIPVVCEQTTPWCLFRNPEGHMPGSESIMQKQRSSSADIT